MSPVRNPRPSGRGGSQNTEAVDGHGDGRLSGLTLKDHTSGATQTVPATALFVLIGAEPHTG